MRHTTPYWGREQAAAATPNQLLSRYSANRTALREQYEKDQRAREAGALYLVLLNIDQRVLRLEAEGDALAEALNARGLG